MPTSWSHVQQTTSKIGRGASTGQTTRSWGRWACSVQKREGLLDPHSNLPSQMEGYWEDRARFFSELHSRRIRLTKQGRFLLDAKNVCFDLRIIKQRNKLLREAAKHHSWRPSRPAWSKKALNNLVWTQCEQEAGLGDLLKVHSNLNLLYNPGAIQSGKQTTFLEQGTSWVIQIKNQLPEIAVLLQLPFKSSLWQTETLSLLGIYRWKAQIPH